MQNKNPELFWFDENEKYGLVLFLKRGQLGKLNWIHTMSLLDVWQVWRHKEYTVHGSL